MTALSAAAIERLAARIDPDGTLVHQAIRRHFGESSSSTRDDDKPDAATTQVYLAQVGVEVEDETRMYAGLDEKDIEYLRGYACDLGLRPGECVTVEIESER